ncbi:MAG: hypothetical protein AB1758_01470 [Candidatus Eremiobacterota bacterium]
MRDLSVYRVLAETFRLYRAVLPIAVGLVAIVYLPVYVLAAWPHHDRPDSLSDPLLYGPLWGSRLAMGVGPYLQVLLGPLSTAPLLTALSLAARGERPTWRAALRGLRRSGSLLLTYLAVAPFLLIGALFLVWPAVYFALCYCLIQPVAVLEGRGPWAALHRSETLTEGYRLRILGIFLILLAGVFWAGCAFSGVVWFGPAWLTGPLTPVVAQFLLRLVGGGLLVTATFAVYRELQLPREDSGRGFSPAQDGG